MTPQGQCVDFHGLPLHVGQTVELLDFRQEPQAHAVGITPSMVKCIGRRSRIVEMYWHLYSTRWCVRIESIHIPGYGRIEGFNWGATWFRAVGGLRHLVHRYQKEAAHG